MYETVNCGIIKTMYTMQYIVSNPPLIIYKTLRHKLTLLTINQYQQACRLANIWLFYLNQNPRFES